MRGFAGEQAESQGHHTGGRGGRQPFMTATPPLAGILRPGHHGVQHHGTHVVARRAMTCGGLGGSRASHEACGAVPK